MKNTIILLAIFIAGTLQTVAGNYEETMGKNIAQLYQTQNGEQLIALSNTFDRIAQKEATKWLPYYYSSYASLSVLFFSSELSVEEKMTQLQNAQEKLDKAMEINNQESEIHVLQALIYQMSITDPSLGQKYSMLSNKALAKAKTLNPENPRYYYIKGTNVFYTPEEFGGGKAVAKDLFEKAAGLFESNRAENPLLPNWGSQHNKMMLEQCQ